MNRTRAYELKASCLTSRWTGHNTIWTKWKIGSKSAFCAHETQYLQTNRQNLSNAAAVPWNNFNNLINNFTIMHHFRRPDRKVDIKDNHLGIKLIPMISTWDQVDPIFPVRVHKQCLIRAHCSIFTVSGLAWLILARTIKIGSAITYMCQVFLFFLGRGGVRIFTPPPPPPQPIPTNPGPAGP
jgi:hypothetical protein